MKSILDATAGNRFMWFKKNNKYVVFVDKRVEKKGYDDFRPNREIKPNIKADFRELPFSDNLFYLVIFDPPHIISKNSDFRYARAYGVLHPETWREDIKKGFDECWRVLKPYGVLIFKWSEVSIQRKELLKIIGRSPLFGHTIHNKNKTHWFVFMKFPKKEVDEK